MLGSGDPLALTLAADFRLCSPDFSNDHVWELETGGGDPPALSMRTTYGLRARSMRIFPRFGIGSQVVSDPSFFQRTLRLRHFSPNFLSLTFSPFADIDTVAEYWVPNSHTIAGRLVVSNRGNLPVVLLLELCGQLVPNEGRSLAPFTQQSVNALAGQTADLAPVIFLSGGCQPGSGAYPSLVLHLSLASQAVRTLTWAQAALETLSASFELARHTASRHWEAERAKIELTNVSQTIDVYSGDQDWDAAFAFSQKSAYSMYFAKGLDLPDPFFTSTRLPDNSSPPTSAGGGQSSALGVQSMMEACYLFKLLPGAPELAAGFVRNFLKSGSGNGKANGISRPESQRRSRLTPPLLASLAWDTFDRTQDLDFLREVYPGLEAFINSWLSGAHDRDGDGFPEWEHPLQAGLEDDPAFTVWREDGQGAEIAFMESPALAAMLCRETNSQALISKALGRPDLHEKWSSESRRLRAQVDECWGASAMLYHGRDRDTHSSPPGKIIATRTGAGCHQFDLDFRQPVRLLIRLEFNGDATRRPGISLRGMANGASREEKLERLDFQWGPGKAVATTREVYSSLSTVDISGLERLDRVVISVMDFSAENITLLLPLWAEIPDARRALNIISLSLLDATRFDRPFGIPQYISAGRGKQRTLPMEGGTIHIPWNAMIGEGLLHYGFRTEAARLTSRLMAAVVQNLKRQHAFARAYHAERGSGSGERNPILGLAPLGLFLDTLGVRILSNQRVILGGKNPFPWPVTVQYRGMTITRNATQTLVNFPDGSAVTLDDPSDAEITMDAAASHGVV